MLWFAFYDYNLNPEPFPGLSRTLQIGKVDPDPANSETVEGDAYSSSIFAFTPPLRSAMLGKTMKNPVTRTLLFVAIIIGLYVAATRGTTLLLPATWKSIGPGVPEIQAKQAIPELTVESTKHDPTYVDTSLATATKRIALREWRLVVEYKDHKISSVKKEHRDWPSPTWSKSK